MAYTPYTWANDSTGGTQLNATNLNHLETQYSQGAADLATFQASNNSALALKTNVDSLVINVKDHGAKGDGSTDDTAAIQAALTAIPTNGGCLFFPAGRYIVSGVLAITAANTVVRGAGRGTTRIISNSTTADVFTVGTNAIFATIRDLAIMRSVTPTNGAGVHFLGASSGTYSNLSDLYVSGHYRGVYCTSSTYGWITRIIVEACVSDGVFFTNDSQGALQWQVTDSIAQGNGGDGWRVVAQTGLGAAQITMGTWTNVATFANSGYGVSFEGVATCPIQDVRLVNCFLGADGGSEVFLDTYGQSHLIKNVFTELTGSSGTGIGLATAASGFGHGIVVSANNADVTINGGTHSANSQSGIYNNGADTIVTGVSFRNNGQNSDAAISSNSGIFNAGGNLTATGNAFKGNPYGIYTNTDTILAVGNTVRPSAGTGTAQAITGAVTLSTSVVASNRLIAP